MWATSDMYTVSMKACGRKGHVTREVTLYFHTREQKWKCHEGWNQSQLEGKDMVESETRQGKTPHLGAEGVGNCDEQLVLPSYHWVTNGGQLALLLHTQGTSKAAWAAEQAQRQSEAAWQDQIRACCHEDELVRKAEEAEEKVRNAQQASKGVAEKARAAQAAAEKATCEAAKYTRAAREVQEEVEKCLQRGIWPVVIPMLDKIAAAKTRVQYEQGCFHFVIAGVLGSGKSLLINTIHGVENQNQGAAETIPASEGGS
ncbi:hypothetical protein BKA83DRAFT_4546856 [Pisolithus microcarpus]|nr:hypothetical protein BKA83DRAFT_4546856 [Pisolithus microcarpus]